MGPLLGWVLSYIQNVNNGKGKSTTMMTNTMKQNVFGMSRRTYSIWYVGVIWSVLRKKWCLPTEWRDIWRVTEMECVHVTFCIRQSTPSPSPSIQWCCHRHIVGSLQHHTYVPSASLATFCAILGPPSSYQTRSRNKPFHGTSLLHLAPLSLCNPSHVSRHGNLRS